MSLSSKIANSSPRRQNRGCETCKWLARLTAEDQQSVQDWLDAGWSMRQLHEICASDEDDPLPVTLTAFKNHLRDCAKK